MAIAFFLTFVLNITVYYISPWLLYNATSMKEEFFRCTSQIDEERMKQASKSFQSSVKSGRKHYKHLIISEHNWHQWNKEEERCNRKAASILHFLEFYTTVYGRIRSTPATPELMGVIARFDERKGVIAIFGKR